MKKIVYLFPTNREKILEAVRAGQSPDNGLYGLNYFKPLGWRASLADVSPARQNFLDKVFFLLGRLFREQIDITFQLGRALLMLPEMNKSDVVLANTDSIGLPVCLLKRLGLVRPPVVYAVGLFYIQGKLKESVDNGKITLFFRFYRWILSAAGHIVYHSPIEKEKLVKLGLYNPAYCTFAAMGSDANFFKVKRSDPGARLPARRIRRGRALKGAPVLAVGRDHARDYKTLFKAAKKLPEAKFIVVCSWRNIEGLSIPKNVQVLFDLTYQEIADWYRQAVVAVIPMKEMYRSSGQMTLTDAIQAGKPIVVSDVVGIRHYGLRNGVDALLIPSENREQLKQAIHRVISDSDLRARLEKQAEKLAKIFTTENYAKNISEAVEWAIDPVKLRPLRREDLEFARRLRNENRQYFLDSTFISRKDQQRWFEKYQKKTNDLMFVLEDEKIPIGIGAIYNIDQSGKSAEVGRLIIDSSCGRKGCGRVLMEKLEQMAKGELGLERLHLEVFSDNDSALNLYHSRGFAKIREKTTASNRHVLLMIKSLRGKEKQE